MEFPLTVRIDEAPTWRYAAHKHTEVFRYTATLCVNGEPTYEFPDVFRSDIYTEEDAAGAAVKLFLDDIQHKINKDEDYY